MKMSTALGLTVLFLLLELPASEFARALDYDYGCPEDLNTVCRCGEHHNNAFVKLRVKACPLPFHFGNDVLVPFNLFCAPCESKKNRCEKFRQCLTCTEEGCLTCPPGRSGLFCENDATIYPIMMDFQPGDNHSHTISKRAASFFCHIPTSLQTAEIRCMQWPKWIRCVQHCIYGYVFPGPGKVDSREMSCRTSEEKWKPHGFEECKPIIDCDVRLHSPGEIECISNKFTPKSCNISCSATDDKPAVNRREYFCYRNGWIPILPHCVKKDQSID